MELLSILMDIVPPPPSQMPGEPGLWARFIAWISAMVGGIVWSAYKLIRKTINKKGDKK